jgi:U3 small nucleolar RNA-associated protein 11
MSSSMRNALPRRSHRERPQPHIRTRRGLLEKRKDYLLRKKSHESQSRTLKRLAEKALERNPDEFYFGMARERTKGGVAVVERAESRSLGVKETRGLKAQDVRYLRTVRSIERGRIRRLKDLVGVESQAKGRIVFAEDEGEGTMSLVWRLIQRRSYGRGQLRR